MENSERKINGNTQAAGKNLQPVPGPTGQANGDSSRPREQENSANLVRGGIVRTRTTDEVLPPHPFPGARGPMPPALTLADIIKSIRRYKGTALLIFILIAVPAIAAIWTQIVPMYQAQAEVRVRPIIPYLVFETEESGKIPLYDSFVNTQVSILQNQQVLRRVLDLQEIQQTQWYRNPSKSLVQKLRDNVPAPITRLEDNLSARPRKETEIIDVTFVDSSAGDAQLILNNILDQYIRYIREKTDATQDEIYRALTDQYKSLENEILGRENVIAEIQRSLGTATPQELVANKRLRLDQTQSHLSEVQQNLVLIEWELARLTNQDSNDVQIAPVDTIAKPPAYYEDELWRQHDSNVKALKHQLAVSVLTPNHPDRSRMEKDLEFAEELLQQRQEQLDELWQNQLNAAEVPLVIADSRTLDYQEALIYLKHQLARTKREEELLLAELKREQTEFQALFENAQLLEKENNDQLHKRELFDAVRQRLDQKNMERNVPGSIEILTRAAMPTGAYNDRRIVLTFMVIILALGAGGGVAFLRAGKSELICAPEDMPYPMQVSLLGSIPEIKHAVSIRGSLRSRYDEIQFNRSRVNESVRVVRTALLSRLNGRGGTTILITSAASGTGKSSFTLMLGKSLAQAGKEILIIDADFHKRTLTNSFQNLSEQPGFVQALRNGFVKDRHIFQTETSGLSILPAGKKDDNEVVFEEITIGAFKDCIDKLRQQYDIILLDSPSIVPVADAIILSNQVDGIIIVERELISHRTDVIHALARLGSAGGHLLGTVLIGSSDQKNYG